MRWFRLHTRPTACLAFFALALQLVLSFGHAHGDKLRLSAADAKVAAFSSIKSGSTDTPAGPAQQDNDDFCAICASVTLGGSLILPTPPAAALPPAIDSAWIPPAGARTASNARRFLFQARAPPVCHQGDAFESCRAVA
jgi:hypothetical protein